ncbi:MAG: hypothetical protein ACREDQ_13030 [Limisphaerales bacterium]
MEITPFLRDPHDHNPIKATSPRWHEQRRSNGADGFDCVGRRERLPVDSAAGPVANHRPVSGNYHGTLDRKMEVEVKIKPVD